MARVAALLLALASLAAISSPASAQLLRLLAPLPILARLSPVTELVGIEIVAADAVAADSFSAPVMLGPGDELGLSATEERALATMDAPPRSRRAAPGQRVAAPDGVLAQGGDQMGLYPLQTVQPDFPDVRTQTATDCPDEDEDGVCDRDDQCRRTPPGRAVMGNGCYLSAGQPSRHTSVAPAAAARIEAAVYFASASAELDAAGERTLKMLAVTLRESHARLRIVGYSDATGEAETNRQLSLRRAMAVREGLLAAGVSETRIAGVQGRGVADSATGLSSRARRVELWLIRQ